MKIGQRRSIWVIVGLPWLAAALSSPPSAAANPQDQHSSAMRPLVSAVLQSGEQVEGLLERFDDGVYWLLVGQDRRKFAEQDLQSIQFRSASTPPPPTAEDAALTQLIQRFFTPAQQGKGAERGANTALISQLASYGERAVRPLLAAFNKQDDDYQAVGEVLKQIGPEVFPLLIDCVREDSGRSARFPVWWALRESGTRHAPFVQAMLKDKDPRIRLLAMEVLHSWSITSGTVLPKTLDLSLIQILDDPDDDVRSQAPLILGRIGFNSELVFPTLLRTLEDDAYAGLRSKSVIALGHLGRDLKPTDPDLARLVSALARSLLHDPNDHIRSRAAYYLGHLGPKSASALPALRQATDDKTQSVREQAEEALQMIEHPEANASGKKKGRGKSRPLTG